MSAIKKEEEFYNSKLTATMLGVSKNVLQKIINNYKGLIPSIKKGSNNSNLFSLKAIETIAEIRTLTQKGLNKKQIREKIVIRIDPLNPSDLDVPTNLKNNGKCSFNNEKELSLLGSVEPKGLTLVEVDELKGLFRSQMAQLKGSFLLLKEEYTDIQKENKKFENHFKDWKNDMNLIIQEKEDKTREMTELYYNLSDELKNLKNELGFWASIKRWIKVK
jgi:DNA-binding transcriptional MerR regulator